jgi:hypothetical protein
VRRWIFLAAALLVAVFVFAALRERAPSPAPAPDEIDDASREALREILEQEQP